MTPDLKIVLDRIDVITRKLDRFMLTLILFTIYGFINSQGSISTVPFYGKINCPWVLHLLLCTTLTVLFGIIGVTLIDYISKRTIYDKLLENLYTSRELEQQTIYQSLIFKSVYDFTYKIIKELSPSTSERSLSFKTIFQFWKGILKNILSMRSTAVMFLFLLLMSSNAVSIIHSCKAFHNPYLVSVNTALIIGLYYIFCVSVTPKVKKD